MSSIFCFWSACRLMSLATCGLSHHRPPIGPWPCPRNALSIGGRFDCIGGGGPLVPSCAKPVAAIPENTAIASSGALTRPFQKSIAISSLESA